ncbi:u11u12 small nuclear ribonucleo 25 kda [Olea europaea subsp. europaea]|uniref:U11u12 small nuclear ribonucleo 25 kDa n=1 Tax=Olea europaea subsp. europaea TaxID=158383 RepID=A0A8S0VMF3_OLEEU|nr:u11u12 small nuclear ribonucleo 25 kda [Olea europaea subsp. europaea]
MHIVEKDDDFYAPTVPNGSMSSAFHYSPLFCVDNFSRRSFSYNKLPEEPLRLTVLKLDGSSFEIQVAKNGRVRELKLAVEAAFGHLPTTGAGRVSWPHVWGQFCLSYNGHKLLNDNCYLETYKIKDGDQLRFIRHDSINYNLARTQSEKEDSDLDDEPEKDRQENVQSHYIEILENKQDNRVEFNKGVVANYDYKLTHLLRGWFPFHKLPSSNASEEDD